LINNFTFTTFLTDNAAIDAGAVKDITSKQKRMHVQKGTFLLQEGEICKHSFFVENGLLRYYSIDVKGKEHIIQFAPEGWFVGDRESMFFNKPSQYFIQALEETDVVMINDDLICTISKADKKFAVFNNNLLFAEHQYDSSNIAYYNFANGQTSFFAENLFSTHNQGRQTNTDNKDLVIELTERNFYYVLDSTGKVKCKFYVPYYSDSSKYAMAPHWSRIYFKKDNQFKQL